MAAAGGSQDLTHAPHSTIELYPQSSDQLLSWVSILNLSKNNIKVNFLQIEILNTRQPTMHQHTDTHTYQDLEGFIPGI